MITAKMATMVGEFVAIFGGLLSVLIALLAAKPQQPNYLRRVAKKYSVRPLDLRS